MKTIKQTMRNFLSVILLGALTAGSAFCADSDSAAQGPRKSPDWLRSAVVYEIFPQNFSKEGDLNAITARLDDLKDLGVDIVWLMPIHPVGEKLKKGSLGSPYAVRDFYAINPALGTTNDFKRLVDEAHARKLKVIMDIVAGQTAWDSVMMSHPDYYMKDSSGNIIPPKPTWTDVAGLDYKNPDLRNYMIDMMKYWLGYGVDGFRCDVAYTVPVDFWEAARVELEKVNPQIIIITDAGAKPSLLSKAFDMDYAWNLYISLNQVMESTMPAYGIQQSWEHTREQFPKGTLHLRFTDNQSEVRAVARYGLSGAMAAQVCVLMLDGVPMFYNGMEVGDATESYDPAMFEKMPVLWNPGGRPHEREIYRDLIKLRKQNPAFIGDDVNWLQNTASGEVVSFERKDVKDDFVILINFSSRVVTGSVEVENPDGFRLVKIDGKPFIDSHLPDFRLNGFDWQIYHRATK